MTVRTAARCVAAYIVSVCASVGRITRKRMAVVARIIHRQVVAVVPCVVRITNLTHRGVVHALIVSWAIGILVRTVNIAASPTPSMVVMAVTTCV